MSSLASLLKQSPTNSAAVLAAADAALKASPKDVHTQHVKVVAQLNLERFEDALATLKAGGADVQRAASLEHAYALYKTGQLAEARKIADSLQDRAGRHLQAQVSFRSEDFANAAEIYRALWAEGAAEEEGDLRINSGATAAQLQWSGQGDLVPDDAKRPSREDLETFVTAYNAACGCLARGELAQGELLLKRAHDMCLALQDLADSEKKTELLPIQVQRLYVLTALGKLDEAEALAEEITVDEIPDAATKQIAQINKLAAQSKPTNQYLAHRIFQTLPSLPPTDYLFKVQHDLVQQNKTALDLLLFKFPGVVDSTKRELKEYPMPTLDTTGNSLSAANAAAQAQCQLGKLGLKSILPLLEKRPLDVGLALTVVQLYVVTKNHGAAIKVMESLFKRLEEAQTDDAQEVRFAPGVVAVLVSLYSIEGQKSHIRRELAKAATFWRHRSKTHPAFFRATGLSLLQSGKQEDLKEAQGIFAALRETNPNDSTANAGFVAAFATTDPTKVTEPANKLTPIEKLTAGIDATALDQAGVPVLQSTAAAQAASRKRAAEAAAKPPKKRVRQSRKLKDLDPKKKPDPERWLPLRDRSTYKPKGKKGKQKQAALTQGGISKDAADSGAETKAEVSKGGGGGGGKSKKKGRKK